MTRNTDITISIHAAIAVLIGENCNPKDRGEWWTFHQTIDAITYDLGPPGLQIKLYDSPLYFVAWAVARDVILLQHPELAELALKARDVRVSPDRAEAARKTRHEIIMESGMPQGIVVIPLANWLTRYIELRPTPEQFLDAIKASCRYTKNKSCEKSAEQARENILAAYDEIVAVNKRIEFTQEMVEMFGIFAGGQDDDRD